MNIGTGSICFIVKTAPGNEPMLGRVVTVIGPARPMVANGGSVAPHHPIAAEWLHREHRGFRYYARPECLRPINAPDKPPTTRRKRIPEIA